MKVCTEEYRMSERDEETARFPASRTRPKQTAGGFKDLGVTPLVKQLGLKDDQTNGHWCSRCEGIWFGYTLEAQCPVCGNRNG
jgi:rubrerythrin